jgi:outer membrane receptor protein involved in Fe transport
VTGSFAWTPPVSDLLSSLIYIDFRYQSEMNTGSDLDFEKIQDGFIVANARIGLYGPGEVWGLELWAQNLFDTLYQQVAADVPLQGSGTFRAVAQGLAPTANGVFMTFPAEPRTFGVTLRTRF